MLHLTSFPLDKAGAGRQALQIGDGALRSVRIVENQDEGRALAELVRQLNFLPELTEGVSPDARATLASIVSDRSAAPFEACAALKRHGPIIMISSDTSFAFRLAAARAGVEAIVRRPLDPLELAGWLEHFATRASGGSISVLIIDDDPLMAELCGEVLQAAGMTVATLNDPALAPSVIEATLPDLVVMDMWMPQVDGVELARIIRQSRRFTALPIIFLSGELNPERQLAARMLGGDDFIVKPVDPQKLVALLRLRAERARVLRTMIERDSLTGLYDHGRFKERLSHELERCRKFGGELCLVMIDIDRFKSVNDRFGHLLGDGVIRALSGLLCGGLRKSDIVGRYGGEEFGVILLDTEPRSARRVIDKLRRMFEQVSFDADGRSFSVTFSAGIACSRHYGGLTDLIAATDVALYRAKHAGRNRVELMQPEVPRH